MNEKSDNDAREMPADDHEQPAVPTSGFALDGDSLDLNGFGNPAPEAE